MHKERKIEMRVRRFLIKLNIVIFIKIPPSRLVYVATEEGAGVIFFVHLPGGSSSDLPGSYASYVHSLALSFVKGAVWYCLHRKVPSHTDNATKNISQPGTTPHQIS